MYIHRNWHSHSNTGTPYNGGDSSQSQFSGSFTPSGSQENTFPIPTQQSAIDSLEAVEAGTEEGVYIWGTNIMTQEAAKHFKYFLNGFIIGDDFEPYYVQQMEVMHRTGKFVLNVDCRHLHDFVSTRKLYRQLIDYPQDMFQILDTVVMNEYEAIYGHYDNHPTITVRVYGLPNASAMRNLDPGDIERLVAIKGMIIRVSPVIPDLIQAFFRCYVCADTVEVVLNKGRIDEPNSCPSCQRLGSMQMIHNRSTYGDKQLIRMQETPDEVPEGETPYTVSLYAFGDLVDSVRPGDRVEVTGVFRAIPRRTNPRQRSIASVYKTYVDCIHMRRVDVSADESSPSAAQSRSNISSSTDAMAASIQAVDPTAEDQNDVGFRKFSAEKIEMFHEFARSGDIYGKLVKSFAPSIFEMDDVKRGVLCLLFGGTLPEARVCK